MIIAERKRLATETELNPQPAVRLNVAAKKCTLLTILVLSGFILCLLYTYQTTAIIALSYQTAKIKTNIDELQRENRSMELKIAELQAPERVEQVATAKLGMKEPEDYLIASCSPEQLSPKESQIKTPAPNSSWGGRLLAAIPRFIGRAEASPR